MSDVEDNEDAPDVYFKPSFVLIAIDTHPSMFVTRENENGTITHPFKDCLEACYELADSLILSTNRRNWSQFGVLLADDDENKANLVDIENSLLDSIKILKYKSQLVNKELKEMYERKGDLDLSAFFLLCKKKFKNIKSAFYKRTIIFISNDDDPIKGDKNKRFTAINEAKTFEPSEIRFQLVTMNKGFDYSIFYNELYSVYSEPCLIQEVCEDKDGLLSKLTSSIVVPFTKRKLIFYPFKNDNERYLKVIKVDFIKTEKLYNSSSVSKDGRLLKRIKMEGTFENPVDMLKYTIAGACRDLVTLDYKDRCDIYNNTLSVGYNFMYVSKRNTDVGFVLSPPSLLQVDPAEDLLFFDQYWQYCITNDSVLVCIRKYRSPDKIRFVELIPKFANNMKLFLIKHIPFCTEIKIPQVFDKDYPKLETNENKIACINNLIKELSFDYDPIMLPDPVYAKKKAYIKAKLLDEQMEEVVDISLNTEEMDKKLKKIVDDINSTFDLLNDRGKKRKPATSTAGSKKAK